MSANMHGITSTLIRQTNETLKLFSDGTVEATVSFKCPFDRYRANLPVPLQPHPDFPSLKLFEFGGAREEGDIYRYDNVYKGVFASQDLFLLMQENVNVTTTQEPVETFYKFSYPWTSPPVSTKQLAQIQAALEANIEDITTLTGWPSGYTPPSSSAWGAITADTPAWNLWKLRRRGIDSYLRTGATAQLNFVTSDTTPPTGDYLNRIATTDHITTAWTRATTVPTTAGNRDWLFSGVSWRRSGGAIAITEDHTLSGPNQWNPYLYAKVT